MKAPTSLRARQPRQAQSTCATRSFCWDTGKQRSWRTTLTVRFQPAGLDLEAGRYLPDRYEAVLSNSRLPVTSTSSATEMMMFDLTVARAPVSTVTLQTLDRFCEVALMSLRYRYLTGDPRVCGYFAAPPYGTRSH